MSIQLYPSVAKVKRNGVYENLPAFDLPSSTDDTRQMIATSESSSTAQYVHNAGEYFILNGTLYQALVKINVGDNIVVGTNCKVAVVGNDVSAIANSVADYELGIATGSHNIGDYFFVNDTLYVATSNIQVGDTISTSSNCRKAVVGDEVTSLKNAITENCGIVIAKGDYSKGTVLFTKDDIPVGTEVYYKFSVPSGKSCYLEFFDSNNTRITYVGKGASSSGDLNYEGTITLADTFDHATVSGSNNVVMSVSTIGSIYCNDSVIWKSNSVKTQLNDTETSVFSVAESLLSTSQIQIGSGLNFDGTNLTNEKLARTDYLSVSHPFLIILDSTTYEIIVHAYSGLTVSTRIRSLTDKIYTQDPVIVPITDGIKYIRIGFRRLDGATLTSDDATSFLSKISFNKITDTSLNTEYLPADSKAVGDKFKELFALGDSLLKETDIIETATAVVDEDMYTTAKPGGNTRTTEIIDMGSTAGRVYTGRNVYAVYAYDADGNYVDRVTGPTTSGGDYTFDLSSIQHRYIRVLVLIKFRLDHDLVLGSTIADSSHRGKLINELNTENTISKRVYMRGGDLSSSKFRMGFCAYTNNNVLLLGGEMRYSSGADNSDISIAYTRSLDNGRTFETSQILFERNVDADVTYHTKSCGQFLTDANTGRIYCFCLREDSNVNRLTTYTNKAGYDSSILYKYSDDDGSTWSAENTLDLRDDDMMILCPSPTHGITMSDGTLVVPAWALFSDGTKKSLIIYSADHGTTWQKCSAYIPVTQSNECCVVETLTSGTLLLNCRDESSNYRAVYTTSNLGTAWTEHVTNGCTLWSPICQADLLRIDLNGGLGETFFLYSSPFGSGRTNTKILCSHDLINWDEFATITTTLYQNNLLT